MLEFLACKLQKDYQGAFTEFTVFPKKALRYNPGFIANL